MKTNVKTILLMLCIALVTISCKTTQTGVTLNVSQDAKLLFKGDNKGNSAGTIDITIRSEWQGNQQSFGYFFIAPEFEYADLNKPYRRYSANVGYTFNKLPVKNIAATSSIGFGIIDHYKGYKGFGANFQLAYEITPDISPFLDLELVDRKDLTYWGPITYYDRIIKSLKFGVKYRF